MKSLIDRYILKEILKTELVVLFILFFVFLSQSLIRLISRAATGRIPSGVIGRMALLSLPDLTSIMLPLALFISILLTLGRICSDSEMVVMRSVGYSPARVMGITLILAFVTGLISLVNGIYLMPEAARARADILTSAQNNPQYLPIESGRFISVAERFTIYVDEVHEHDDNESLVQNIFVMENPYDAANAAVTIAQQGSLMTDEDGVQWLHLVDGSRYEGSQASGSYRRVSFKTFDAPISSGSNEEQQRTRLEQISTKDLLNSAELSHQIEAQWRFSSFFAAIVLSIIAVPLAMVNPRQGRFARFVPAILLYASYYMCTLSMLNIVNSSGFSAFPGLYLIPAAFLILVAVPLNLPRHIINRHLKEVKSASGGQ